MSALLSAAIMLLFSADRVELGTTDCYGGRCYWTAVSVLKGGVWYESVPVDLGRARA